MRRSSVIHWSRCQVLLLLVLKSYVSDQKPMYRMLGLEPNRATESVDFSFPAHPGLHDPSQHPQTPYSYDLTWPGASSGPHSDFDEGSLDRDTFWHDSSINAMKRKVGESNYNFRTATHPVQFEGHLTGYTKPKVVPENMDNTNYQLASTSSSQDGGDILNSQSLRDELMRYGASPQSQHHSLDYFFESPQGNFDMPPQIITTPTQPRGDSLQAVKESAPEASRHGGNIFSIGQVTKTSQNARPKLPHEDCYQLPSTGLSYHNEAHQSQIVPQHEKSSLTDLETEYAGYRDLLNGEITIGQFKDQHLSGRDTPLPRLESRKKPTNANTEGREVGSLKAHKYYQHPTDSVQAPNYSLQDRALLTSRVLDRSARTFTRGSQYSGKNSGGWSSPQHETFKMNKQQAAYRFASDPLPDDVSEKGYSAKPQDGYETLLQTSQTYKEIIPEIKLRSGTKPHQNPKRVANTKLETSSNQEAKSIVANHDRLARGDPRMNHHIEEKSEPDPQQEVFVFKKFEDKNEGHSGDLLMSHSAKDSLAENRLSNPREQSRLEDSAPKVVKKLVGVENSSKSVSSSQPQLPIQQRDVFHASSSDHEKIEQLESLPKITQKEKNTASGLERNHVNWILSPSSSNTKLAGLKNEKAIIREAEPPSGKKNENHDSKFTMNLRPRKPMKFNEPPQIRMSFGKKRQNISTHKKDDTTFEIEARKYLRLKDVYSRSKAFEACE